MEGLEAVRRRPGMYIGTTGSRGLHHLLWEIVDNSIDEAANGFADRIEVVLYQDGSISVEDNGRGIPVGLHPELRISGVEVIMTKLHAGGKFSDSNYAYSGGLHGVGAAVVNALSKSASVEVFLDGRHYKQSYSSYIKNGKIFAGVPDGPLSVIGQTKKRGTKTTFMPDPEVFDETNIHYDRVAKRLKTLAYLASGVTIILRDERQTPEKRVEYNYIGGLSDFVISLNESKKPLNEIPIKIEGEKDGVRVAVAMQYTESTEENVFSFVNNVATPDGGMHVTGFRSAVTKALGDYMQNSKEKLTFEGDDFREGLTAAVSIKIKNAQFEGQTKTRLGNAQARTAVEAVVLEGLTQYFQDLNNAAVCQRIAEKAVNAAKVREYTKKAKQVAREKLKADTAPLVGKLSSCTGRDYKKNELFIVEGDSAGGSAKMGRDRKFQAILPLRGKPLNVEKKRIEQVLANEEFRSIITALGCGFDTNINLKNLKYDKIIILADADQDGAHIRAILLTFFFRYFPQLIDEGHVYIAQPPLYSVAKRRQKTQYAHSEKQLEAIKKEMGRGCEVKRFKGLGEMNAEELWETTLDPENRVLLRVDVQDRLVANNLVSKLMGDDANPRRDYINEYANFNKVDNFRPEG